MRLLGYPLARPRRTAASLLDPGLRRGPAPRVGLAAALSRSAPGAVEPGFDPPRPAAGPRRALESAHPPRAECAPGVRREPTASRRSPPPSRASESVAEPEGAPIPEHSTTAARASWRAVLLGCWAFGSTAFLLLVAHRRRLFRRVIAGAQPIEEGPLFDSLGEWRRKLGLRRKVRLVTSGAGDDPLHDGLAAPRRLPAPRRALPVGYDAGRKRARPRAGPRQARRRRPAHPLPNRPGALLLPPRGVDHGAGGSATNASSSATPSSCARTAASLRAPTAAAILQVLRMNLEPAEPIPALGNTRRRLRVRMEGILSPQVAPRTGSLPAIGLAAVIGTLLLPMDQSRAAAPEAPFKIVVNADNPVRSISRSELAKLFLKQRQSLE